MELKEGYKQTEVGVIPEDWETPRLNELVDPNRTIRYGIVQPGKYDPNGRYMIRGQDYSKGWVDPSEFFRVSPAVEEPFANARVKTGDVLITIVGASTGRIAVVPEWLNGANLTQTTARISLRAQLADGRYCSYLLASPAGADQVSSYLKGAAQPGLNCGDIEKFIIPIPPTKAEQEAIAEALSDADALIESLERLIAKKRQIKQGAMQELLTRKKRLPGFTGEWEVTRADKIGKFRGGSGFPTRFQGATSGRYPFFKVSDMNNPGNEIFMRTSNNRISDSVRKQLGAVVFPEGSIVFAKVGAAVFLERKKILNDPSCLDNNMAAFLLEKDQVDCRFMHYMLLDTKLGALVRETLI